MVMGVFNQDLPQNVVWDTGVPDQNTCNIWNWPVVSSSPHATDFDFI